MLLGRFVRAAALVLGGVMVRVALLFIGIVGLWRCPCRSSGVLGGACRFARLGGLYI